MHCANLIVPPPTCHIFNVTGDLHSVLGFKMDDCNLSKLTVKPGTLSPVFKKDVTDYSVTVPSSAEKIVFDPRTSDTGASYAISVRKCPCF